MAGITSSGLGSGLPIDSLVSQLVSAEGKPETTRLAKKEAKLQANLSALGAFKGALAQFQSSITALKATDAFQTRKTTVSNNELLTATATSTAAVGSFSIRVDQLAQSAKMRTTTAFASDTNVMGEGTLMISLGASPFSVAVSPTATLTDVRDSINQAIGNPGVKASIVKVDAGYQLVLSSDKVGAANSISVTATDNNAMDGNDLTRLQGLTTVQAATDAIIQVDGQTATKSSNSFSDVISGVTITLKKADPATATLGVALDKESVTAKINSFVNSYNNLASTMKSLSNYDQTTKQASVLFGDSTLMGAKSQIRHAISNPVSGLSGLGTLAELGIKTNKEGVLVVDNTKLGKMLDTSFESVTQLFTATDGLAKRLDTVLTNFTSSTGSVTVKMNSINKQIDGIGEQRIRLNSRLDAVEARYRKQFNSMDQLVGGLQATGSYLTQQLANLPGFVEKTN